MKYHVVSTMNEAGWKQHGKRMAESFVRRWPDSANLTIYAEGFEVDVPGIEVRTLPPWIDAFKARYRAVPKYNGNIMGRYDFRFDLVKFAHKVAALTDFGLSVDNGVMIWLDADTFFHSDVTEEFLDGLFPEPAYIAWLDRRDSFPETGFVMFRAGHGYHHSFMESLRNLYTSGEVTAQKQWHDAFLIWELAKAKIARGKIPPHVNLSGEAWRTSHPAINGPLGAVLDHMKGPRKDEGISRRRDIVFVRKEPYWKNAR